MKKTKEYKRSYKNLVMVFLTLIFSALANLVNCYAFYFAFSGNKPLFYLMYTIGTVITVFVSALVVFLLMSGFNKYTSREIISSGRKKTIFGLSTFVFTMLSSFAQCCIYCCMMYCCK